MTSIVAPGDPSRFYTYASYPRTSYYGSYRNMNEEEKPYYGNIMYDKRVVRGSTLNLRKMALDAVHEGDADVKKQELTNRLAVLKETFQKRIADKKKGLKQSPTISEKSASDLNVDQSPILQISPKPLQQIQNATAKSTKTRVPRSTLVDKPKKSGATRKTAKLGMKVNKSEADKLAKKDEKENKEEEFLHEKEAKDKETESTPQIKSAASTMSIREAEAEYREFIRKFSCEFVEALVPSVLNNIEAIGHIKGDPIIDLDVDDDVDDDVDVDVDDGEDDYVVDDDSDIRPEGYEEGVNEFWKWMVERVSQEVDYRMTAAYLRDETLKEIQ